MKVRILLPIASGLCLLGGVALAQTHPQHHHHHHHQHAAEAAPARPAATQAVSRTPATPPAEGPAPVPNESVSAPIPTQPGDPTVAPSVFQLHYPPQGEGYVSGSSPQAMDDRNAAKATGVEMKLPLTQGDEAQPP